MSRYIKLFCTFAPAIQRKRYAQMAESVDALVSNTSGATRAGSTPALGTFSALKISRRFFVAMFIAQLSYESVGLSIRSLEHKG